VAGAVEATSSAPPTASEKASPEERIETALTELRNSVARDLLENIGRASPTFFEQLVLELLHAMGYGTSRADLQRVGGSGDGGIDGVISLDRLGLEKEYVQAKRFVQSLAFERQLQAASQLRSDQIDVVRSTFALDHGLPDRSEPGWNELLDIATTGEQSIRDRAVQLSSANMPPEDKAILGRAASSATQVCESLRADLVRNALRPAHAALVDIVAAELAAVKRALAARAALAAFQAVRPQEDVDHAP
jgi:hypothetical protein